MTKIEVFEKLKKGSYEALNILKQLSLYEEYVLEYLENNFEFLLDAHIFNVFIYLEDWPYEWVLDNINKFIIPENNANYTEHIYIIMKKAIGRGDYQTLKLLAYNKDLRIVRSVMKDLSFEFPRIFKECYELDVLKYIHSYDNDGNVISTIEERHLSEIAANLADYEETLCIYYVLRNYILNNFKYNSIALNLLNNYGCNILADEINLLFSSQNIGKYVLSINYCNYIDNDLLTSFDNQVKPFLKHQPDVILDILKEDGGTAFLDIATKYLELSNDKTVKYICGGTLSKCYRVGDYIVKVYSRRYMNKEFKVPRLFLISKKIEEIIEYDLDGNIEYGIEVQKCFKKPVNANRKDLLRLYRKELYNLGYFLGDCMVNGSSPNVYYLDDYHEADCDDPESLPDWFKENPIVLVDIDVVYPIWALLLNDIKMKSITEIDEELGYDRSKGETFFLELHKD